MAEGQSSDQGEKTEEPSQYRLEEFRRKGQVASSKELTSLLVLTGCVVTLALSMVYIYETLAEFVEYIFRLDVHSSFTPKALKTILTKGVVVSLKCAAPVLLVAFCVGVVANIIQVGFIYAPDVLSIKLERVNPLEGIKRLFSAKAIVEAIKGIFKFSIILGIVYLFIKDDIQSYVGYLHLEYASGFIYAKSTLTKLGLSIIAGLALVAAGDFGWEKYSYRKKLMMTKQEAKEEHKQKEGNPEIKQRIKAIQRDIANRRMMAEVPNADVIVTNPTHISVALKYDSKTMVSPELIAKGADQVALRIREIAKEHDIPIVENIPLARGMYKTVKVGGAVPRTLYKAVAEVLAFVYKLKRKKKALS